ncbi:hypothetical protein J6I39_00625 [bacterium]|nr:hypothetical protein [bacterium]
MKKKIFIGLGVAYVVFALILAVALFGNDNNKDIKKTTQKEEAPKWIIAEHEHGDKYPYSEHYLELYCYADSVWFESADGNIYPLNGLAKSSNLKNSPKFNNDTKPILKEGMQDLFTPAEALNICYKLNDAEYQARLKRN